MKLNPTWKSLSGSKFTTNHPEPERKGPKLTTRHMRLHYDITSCGGSDAHSDRCYGAL
jgi:hypothetical protein